MARSMEHPSLRMIMPRAYGKGRDGKSVQYIVIHYTAGSERSTSAEDGAAYDQRRTNGVSTHYFVDRDSVIQCVPTWDRANAAFYKGNRLGIQYELCGTVQSRKEWLDEASLATLKNAARQIARDCRAYDIPPRRLTVDQTRRAWTSYPHGPRGIVGHVDVTRAYPEDGGDHTDPGDEFPWDVLLTLVQAELDNEGDTVGLADDRIELTKQAGAELYDPAKAAGTEVSPASVLQLAAIFARRAWQAATQTDRRMGELTADIAALRAATAELAAATADLAALRQAVAELVARHPSG